LNIRSTPGTDGEILGKLAAGEEVNVLSIQDGWAQIEYQNKTAYISEKYLTAP
ncbi:MAG: SH3 domain-containing protein, partial [Lachnospiraceae bacterium]|nr:SH3 domain-containing protein [Lachnospiraceae bacterium]